MEFTNEDRAKALEWFSSLEESEQREFILKHFHADCLAVIWYLETGGKSAKELTVNIKKEEEGAIEAVEKIAREILKGWGYSEFVLSNGHFHFMDKWGEKIDSENCPLSISLEKSFENLSNAIKGLGDIKMRFTAYGEKIIEF